MLMFASRDALDCCVANGSLPVTVERDYSNVTGRCANRRHYSGKTPTGEK